MFGFSRNERINLRLSTANFYFFQEQEEEEEKNVGREENNL